ncbi:hypothetical protein P5673_022017 [Acropora cervicornis]|uniref:Uncharacterized protein n=1 Tax=Acropora cervicornis TaxID=6130 RepID=A0AAD9UZY1_ACRCE|nr:hypothetical protein P5673_022017 [Acropora cervicornis]
MAARSRLANVSDEKIAELNISAVPKSTQYATKYGVKILKETFCIRRRPQKHCRAAARVKFSDRDIQFISEDTAVDHAYYKELEKLSIKSLTVAVYITDQLLPSFIVTV